MQLSNLVFSLLTVASVALAAPAPQKEGDLVQSNQLRRVLTRSALLAHAARFQSFADADPGKNRAFGGRGHQLTVDYIYDTFKGMSDYYTVEKQEFVHEYAYGTSSFSVEKTKYSSQYFTYSPSTGGPITKPVANVANLGCDIADFGPEVAGKIALVSRGTCDFGLKAVNAGKAGAVAILIYNNIPGGVAGGTYGAPTRPEGPYVPGVMISQEAGLTLKADIAAGAVTAVLDVNAILENRTTYNVIAQTKGGDQNNVIATGGHTDSVGAGPGINDDGSGTIGLLEVAKQLPKWSVNNAIRFCFWSAEEFGLVGSEYYVNSLSAAEQNKIALYLNFDMIASPNFVYFLYDGDGNAFGLTGPPGSDAIEHLFEDYFRDDAGLPTAPTAFDGRSDYGPFLDVGIPAGGLFTGAEGKKTEAQAALFGGKAGEAYDANYHLAGDNIKNVNVGAWIQNTKAIAHSLATYARSTETIPKRAPLKMKREIPQEKKEHNHHSHCGHEDLLL